MRWGSELGENVRYGLGLRENRRQYDISAAHEERRLALLRAAEDRIRQSEAWKRLSDAGLENPLGFEAALPGVDPAMASWLAIRGAADPEAAMADPEYMATRAEYMGKVGPAWEAFQRQETEDAIRKARARQVSGTDFWDRERAKGVWHALTHPPEYKATESFTVDPATGELKWLTPEDVFSRGREAGVTTADRLMRDYWQRPGPRMSPVAPPAPASQPTVPPKAPKAPPTTKPAAKQQRPSAGTAASVLMKAPATHSRLAGQIRLVPAAEVEQAKAAGWTHVLVPVK